MQHLLLSILLVISILVRVKWYLVFVLVFIYVMTNGVAHHLVYLLTTCNFYLNKCIIIKLTNFLKFLLLFNYSCIPFLPIPPPHPSRTHLPPPPPPSPKMSQLVWDKYHMISPLTGT